MRVLFAALALIAGVVLQGAARQAPPALTITTAARSLQPGELIVLSLALDPSAADVRLTGLGKTTTAYHLGGGRWQALLGIDLERAPGEESVTAEARVGQAMLAGSTVLTILPKKFATRTLKVSPDFVDPPASARARIERETILLRDAFARSAPERLWDGPFVRPVPQAANSRFGTRSVFNGQPRNPHTGTDFLSPAGTPIKAPNAGKVVVARDLFFSGQTVILDHGLDVFSQLAHLSRIDVREGERVEAGQVVGLVGATGRVTGAHLHWGFRVGGARVDPLAALALLDGSPGTK